MPKETKKKAAAADEKQKKNALLDADDESKDESSSEDESDDSGSSDEQGEDKDAGAAEEKAAPKSAPVEEKPVAKVNVAASAMSDIQATKAILDAEPKVQFMIPLFEGEKPGSVHQCFINGYEVRVKKGIMTLVPQSIAELLADHYKITSEAGADFRLDLHPNKQNALG